MKCDISTLCLEDRRYKVRYVAHMRLSALKLDHSLSAANLAFHDLI